MTIVLADMLQKAEEPSGVVGNEGACCKGRFKTVSLLALNSWARTVKG